MGRGLVGFLGGFLYLFGGTLPAFALEETGSADAKINDLLGPVADIAETIVFYSIPLGGQSVPIVLILLAGTAIFLTLYFKFINLWAFKTAVLTVRGKYTSRDAPGQITHFQALSAALSATVGLGNIAGVAVAIGLGGPGATFWMILMGFCGMTTKFCECTLGVRYRRIDEEGKVHGGAMYYLTRGLGERGLRPMGLVLGGFFAVMCIGGAFGAGNMFQVNQAHDQFFRTFGFLESGWQFGLMMGILCGLVIIGGIVWIARVTSFLVPFMCVTYVITALVIILSNFGEIPDAIGVIIRGAFSPEAIGGGVIGVLIQGIKRAAFSNEAGLGSAPIAHSAVKTDRPASEGIVALLEPFVDTVVVCTMTALVIVITGVWQVNGDVTVEGAALRNGPEATALTTERLSKGIMVDILEDAPAPEGEDTPAYRVRIFQEETTGWVDSTAITLRGGTSGGVWLTSQAFGSVLGFFPVILAVAVLLFAFSTMISWSYYGQQAVIFLFGHNHIVILIYKLVFCSIAVVGAASSLDNVIRVSDAMVFAMVAPNLIGVYFLLPVVREELKKYMEHVRKA